MNLSFGPGLNLANHPWNLVQADSNPCKARFTVLGRNYTKLSSFTQFWTPNLTSICEFGWLLICISHKAFSMLSPDAEWLLPLLNSFSFWDLDLWETLVFFNVVTSCSDKWVLSTEVFNCLLRTWIVTLITMRHVKDKKETSHNKPGCYNRGWYNTLGCKTDFSPLASRCYPLQQKKVFPYIYSFLIFKHHEEKGRRVSVSSKGQILLPLKTNRMCLCK